MWIFWLHLMQGIYLDLYSFLNEQNSLEQDFHPLSFPVCDTIPQAVGLNWTWYLRRPKHWNKSSHSHKYRKICTGKIKLQPFYYSQLILREICLTSLERKQKNICKVILHSFQQQQVIEAQNLFVEPMQQKHLVTACTILERVHCLILELFDSKEKFLSLNISKVSFLFLQ